MYLKQSAVVAAVMIDVELVALAVVVVLVGRAALVEVVVGL